MEIPGILRDLENTVSHLVLSPRESELIPDNNKIVLRVISVDNPVVVRGLSPFMNDIDNDNHATGFTLTHPQSWRHKPMIASVNICIGWINFGDPNVTVKPVSSRNLQQVLWMVSLNWGGDSPDEPIEVATSL